MNKITVCVLTYGDHLPLIKRCLESLRLAGDPTQVVESIRLGLNGVTDPVRTFVHDWAKAQPCPSIVYEPVGNTLKYPTMRKMFYDSAHPLDEYVMWWDDDSYIAYETPTFWPRCLEQISAADMVGQVWRMRMQGSQWLWVRSQPWCDKSLRSPVYMEFCQGAWWIARTAKLRSVNWPVPELRHNGGDSMLGEVARHNAWRISKWHPESVRINADEHGKHSASVRRGRTEPGVGFNYKGKPLGTEHQEFEIKKTVYGWNNATRG